MHSKMPQAIREEETVASRCIYVNHDAVESALNLCAPGTSAAVTASFVPFHVASHAECFTTSFVGTQEWLLASVRVAVDP